MINRNDGIDGAPAFSSRGGPPVGLLWDQSLPWGFLCVETLERMDIPFHLLSGKDIASGCLDRFRVLLVPGGWASHKIRSLGEPGKSRVKEFIERGGSYLGFCGGAGMALSGRAGLGLVPLERLPLPERLPSASGHVRIRGIAGHPAWKDLPEELPVSIWWPSQFNWHHIPRSVCLASYVGTEMDFCVADIPVADLEGNAFSWEEWEKVYGINLDPVKLMGQPAIMELRAGKGRLILSYPHLETPDDPWGNLLFKSLLAYLDRAASEHLSKKALPESPPSLLAAPPGMEAMDCFNRAKKSVDDLIGFGERHLLWTWRQPWLLQWRRGIRGLEYGTLAVTIRVIAEEAEKMARGKSPYDPWLEAARKIKEDIEMFCRLARRLLLEEKLAIQAGGLTKLGKVNKTVDQLRGRLFGDKMNHGGMCRMLFDELDSLVLKLLRLRLDCPVKYL